MSALRLGGLRDLDFAKVASHQFDGPGRLAYFTPRSESFEIRFYIQNRRAVYRVEFLNANLQPIHRFDFTDGDADTVGTVFRTLGKDAHLRPVSAAARM